jgi:hypothetical protein
MNTTTDKSTGERDAGVRGLSEQTKLTQTMRFATTEERDTTMLG